MPSFYHGSVRIYLRDVVVRLGKDLRNGARKLTRGRKAGETSKRRLEADLNRIVETGDRESACAAAMARVAQARAAADPRELHYFAGALERLQLHDLAFALRSESHDRMQALTGKVWDGTPLSDGSQLTITPMRYDAKSLSYTIQYAGLLAEAARRAPGCKAYMPDRLVPIFARSFPDLDARSMDAFPESDIDKTQFQAPLDHLPRLFAQSSEAIRGLHRPLLADPARVAQLRQRYGGKGPIIGIAWGSSNSRKDVPAFADWAPLLRALGGTVVCLQYGTAEAGQKRIEDSFGGHIVSDPEIDQMADLDAFAAQLAAMDIIISISVTGAHLAGAMGRPMHVLLDDRFHLTWPYFNTTTPWYPNATLHRKAGRPWPEVMQAVLGAAKSDLGAHGTTSPA
jgi:hypothetical protein